MGARTRMTEGPVYYANRGGKCSACEYRFKGREPNPAPEPHPCPFREEIHDDSTSLCECCDACRQECAWDI